jgi:hypothetical protein
MKAATRAEVYAALDSERAYQDARWNNDASPHKKSVEAWLVYMQDYLTEAFRQISREDDAVAKPKALATIRKITAMGVAAMENIGAPHRESR